MMYHFGVIMFRWICALVVIGFCAPAHAQERFDQPSRYELWNADRPYQGECVVRVRTTSQAQLDEVLDIAADVWSERIGIGVLELQLDRDQLGRLEAIGVPYDILIEDLQAHADAHAVDMRAVRQREAAQTADESRRGAGVHDDSWFATYRTLDEITQYCENIALQRPELASISTIGQSWEGRDMFSITISGPDTAANPVNERPALFIFSTVHAREWIAPMTTCYIASKLASDYDTDDQVRMLLDHARVVVVPVGNPDGYLYSWSDERYWRKTRRDNGDGTFGVDINRNWGYEWARYGTGDPGSGVFAGKSAFSEPETAALRDTALDLDDKLIAHVDYHSPGQLVMWPFGYQEGFQTPEPAGSIYTRLGEDIAEVIGDVHRREYVPQQSVELYVQPGNSSDWFFGEFGVTSFTIELRPNRDDFNPPVGVILPNAKENYAGFIRILQRMTYPYNLWGNSEFDPYVWNQPNVTLTSTVTTGLEYAHPQIVQVRTRGGDSGPFNATPMTRLDGSDWYSAQMPAYPCSSVVEYYYEVIDDLGRSGTRPLAGAEEPYTTTLQQLIPSLIDNMEQDTGWTVGHPDDTATAGLWERADPEATSYQPGNDHSPDGTLCWVTGAQAGASDDAFDVEGGSTSLISPRFAARPDEAIGVWFSTAGTNRWPDNYVHMYASNDDGATWVDFGFLFPTNGEWSYFRYDFEPYIETSDQMRMRFVAINNDEDSIFEAAIDDIQIDRIACPPSPADLNGDGTLDFYDVSAFIVAYQSNDPVADFNADGQWDFFDVSLFLEIYLAG
jgi:hypothetical protein